MDKTACFVMQVNAAVSARGELTSLGISTRHWWLLISSQMGIDFEIDPAEVPAGAWPEDSGLTMDLEAMSIVMRSQNADVHAQLTPGGNVRLEVKLKDR